ncbi:hypothetical protein [Peteryoungia ipomoeae]|uniref:Uncharacterized protein n=1 Tax=Peteryoungia ipomoeae TaxID=1210932 RepID=A0A4V4HME1_9HYPH|nr:hypothetical protein [Peteryoungia ipomoeae]THV21636.1 hypothetical protein FAA97_16645 [Peteryoungia ipomoeae]
MRIPRPHLSRKVVLIASGLLVIGGGGTGVAAVFLGTDKILGPSYAELNGFACTEVQTVEIRKKDRFWIRKYVTTDKPADGIGRVKTALRVAKAVQQEKKADLVQVVVLDKAGPTSRALIRGRAVGADILYVPDPSRVPEAASARHLTARYIDGDAAPNGQFFGERFDMIEADIDALVAKLNDQTDCAKLEVALPEGGDHGASDSHGEADAHGGGDAHGAAPADGHGEKPADDHGAAAPDDGHGDAPADGHGEETPVADHGAEDGKGWMASLMGMVGLGGEDASAEGHAADAGDGHAVPPAEAEGHAEGHAAPADAHGETAAGEHEQPAAAGREAAPAEHAAVPADGHGPQDAGHDLPAVNPASPTQEHGADTTDHAKAGAESTDAHGAAAGEGHAPVEPDNAAAEVPATHVEAAKVDDHAAPADDHAAPADDHAAPVEEHAAPAEEHAAPAEEHAAPADDHAKPAEDHAAPAEDHAAKDEAAPADDKGWFDGLKSMVGLGGGEEAAADVAEKPLTGSEDAGPTAEPIQGDDWLAKMRAAPIEGGDAGGAEAMGDDAAAKPVTHPKPANAGGGPDAPAEDEAILPPKAQPKTDEHAKADH